MELIDAVNPGAFPAEALSNVVRSLQERLRARSDVDTAVHIHALIQNMFNEIVGIAKMVALSKLESAFEVFQGGRQVDAAHFYGRDRIGLVARFDKAITFKPVFEMRASGTEIVLTVTPDGGTTTTLFREPLREFVKPAGLREQIAEYFIRGVSSCQW